MGLFGKKKPNIVGSYLGEPVLAEDPASYDTVVEYLRGLSPEDYTKICQVVQLYRQADYEACKVLGIENEPTTFINQPEKDDLLVQEPIFLEDEPPKKSKSKKVTVKDDKEN